MTSLNTVVRHICLEAFNNEFLYVFTSLERHNKKNYYVLVMLKSQFNNIKIFDFLLAFLDKDKGSEKVWMMNEWKQIKRFNLVFLKLNEILDFYQFS